MAELIAIEAQPRELLGSANSRRLRNEGLVPGVLYGKKQGNLNLAFQEDVLTRTLHAHAQVVQVKLPGGASEPAMFKEVQYDRLTDRVVHVDLNRVDLSQRLEVEVELKFVGESKGLKAGGHLETGKRSVMLAARADAIPDELRVDLRDLGLNEVLRVSDLILPEGSSVVGDQEAVIVSCKPAAEVPEEEELAAAGGPAEPEVITKGKKPEDEAD